MATTLPAPNDLPAPPAAVEPPRSHPLPETRAIVQPPQPLALGMAEVDQHTPAIAAITQTTFPDETFSITGHNLLDAHLVVWVAGSLITIEPLRTADDRMQAVLPAHDPDGAPLPRETMLVWPVRDERAGIPIRVNGPDAWWTWPRHIEAGSAGTTLRIFGKNLAHDLQPAVILTTADGAAHPLPVSSHSSYTIQVQLPDDLPIGSHQIHVHNGSAGGWGWSHPLPLDVVRPLERRETVVRVDDHGPTAEDAADAILSAVRTLAQQGGGILQFGPREYRLSRPIDLPAGTPIQLRGAGAGGVDLQTLEASDAQASVIRFHARAPRQYAFTFRTPASAASNLTIIHTGDGGGGCIDLRGPDMLVQHVLLVRRGESRGGANIRSSHRGITHHQILDSELHGFESSVRIQPGSDYVRIADCIMRGWYDRGPGTNSNAVSNHGGMSMIMERCDVAGQERQAGLIYCRTALLYTSDIRFTYIAENHSHGIGPQPNVPGINMNTAEQILYHSLRDELPSMTVQSAEPAAIAVRGDLSAVQAPGDSWIVFIAHGRGAGQWRIIREVAAHDDATRIEVDRPWRVTPDQTSIAVIQQAIRNNLVLGNRIEGDPDPRMPTLGVAWWFNSFGNVTAGNRFIDAGGLYIAARPTKGSSWNLVRDNHWTHRGQGVFFNQMAYPARDAPDETGLFWFALGNAIRSNRGEARDTITPLRHGWQRAEQQMQQGTPFDQDSGMALTIFEHNRFTGARSAFILGPPSPWFLARANDVRNALGRSVPPRYYQTDRLPTRLIVPTDHRGDIPDARSPGQPGTQD